MAITSYKAVMGYYNSAGTPNITTAVTGQLSDGWIPIGAPILTDAYGQCTQMMAKTDATPVIATSAYTVVTAANPQPPDATWDAQGEPLWIDTTTYLQAYTKGGAYLQGTVPVSRGGTGATTTLAAAANLRVFAIPNNLVEITDRSAAWLNLRPTGSLPLGGDPVNDYDATTMRWVKNYVDSGGGGGGASMNGVMNYGVGQLTLWHSRAFIPSYAVVADGQLLSRTAYPELWAHAQMHSPVTDTAWLTGTENRAKFSNGDGSTTFRVPDLNGVQTGSVRGLFGRGSSGVDQYSQPGRVLESALPNITGSFTTNSFQYVGVNYPLVGNRSGAFAQGGTLVDTALPFASVDTNEQAYATDFNANVSSNVYGKYNTNEVVPNSFVGVWIIRANGGFIAANTQWSVRNADSTLPPTSTVVRGGYVRSEYLVGSVLNHVSTFSTYNTVGGADLQRGAEIHTGSASYKFTDAGTAQATNWSSTSDPRVKSLIEVIPDPLDLMRSIRGYSWFYEHTGSKGFGFLSSEVKENFPGAVNTFGDVTLPGGAVVKDVEGVDTSGVSAALHHEAILALMAKVEALEAELTALKSGK